MPRTTSPSQRPLTAERLEPRTVMSAETLVPTALLELEERVNDLLARDLPEVRSTSLPAIDAQWDSAYESLDITSDQRDQYAIDRDAALQSAKAAKSLVESAQATLETDEASEKETLDAIDRNAQALSSLALTQADLTEQRTCAQAEIDRISESITTDEKSLQSEKGTAATLQKSLDALTKTIQSLDALIKDLDALSKSATLRTLRFMQTRQKWYLDTAEIAKRLQTATVDRTSAMKQQAVTQASLDVVLLRIDTLTKKIDGQKSERLKFMSIRDDLTASLADLAEEKMKLEAERATLHDALASIRRTIVDDIAARDAAERSLKEALSTLDATEKLLADAISHTASELAEVLSLGPPLTRAYDEALAALEGGDRINPLPIDTAWPLMGAPSGSLGMVPHPGLGNDYLIDISPDGTEILASSQLNPQVIILDAVTGGIIARLPNQGGIVQGARYSTDGHSIITASYDRMLRVYDRATLSLTSSMPMTNLATRIEPTRDGTIIQEVAEQGIRVIDPMTKTIEDSFGQEATAQSISRDGIRLIYTEKQELRLRIVPTRQEIAIPVPRTVNTTAFSYEGSFIIAGSTDGSLHIADATGRLVSSMQTNMGIIRTIATAPGRIVIGGAGIVQTYALSGSGELTLLRADGIPGTAYGLDVSPSFQTFVVNAALDAPRTSQLVKFPLLEPTPYSLSDTLSPEAQSLHDDALMLGTLTRNAANGPKMAPTNAPIADRINAAFARGTWLEERGTALADIVERLSYALISATDPRARALARTLTTMIGATIAAEREMITVWSRENTAIRMASERLVAIEHADTEPIVSRTDRISLPPFLATAGDDRVARTTAALPSLGGSLQIQALTGRGKISSTLAVTTNDPSLLTSTGSTLVLDFSSAESTVTGASFVIGAQEGGGLVRVHTLGRDGQILSSSDATPGSTVTVSEEAGIYGILIAATRIPYSPDAERLAQHLALGNTADSFFGQNPSLASKRASIEREISVGERFVPLTASEISVTGNIASKEEAREGLNPFTSPAYSLAAAPTLTGIWFPENYSANIHIVNTYSKTGYTGIRPKVYGSAPDLVGFEYPHEAAYGRLYFARIPREFIRKIGDTLVLAPLGQTLRFGITTSGGGQIYRPDLRVGVKYDYELVPMTGPTLADALPSSAPIVDGTIDYLRTVNEGQPPGTWVSGKALEYSRPSPVAIGTIRALTSYYNPSTTAAEIVITVYSGYAGTSGWDSPQATYTTTVGAGQSKQLWTQAYMLANEAGGSVFRITVTSPSGLVYSEYSRTVLAPGRGNDRSVEAAAKRAAFMNAWNTAMTQAAADTKTYLSSIGVTNLPASAFDVPPPTVILTPSAPTSPDAERLLRAAARALASAKESGDAARIRSTQEMYAHALTTYGTAIGLEQGKSVVARAITQLATLVGSELDTKAMLQKIAQNIDAFRSTQDEVIAQTDTRTIDLDADRLFLAELGGMSDEAMKAAYGDTPDAKATLEKAKICNWSAATSWLRDGETSEHLATETVAGKVALGLAIHATKDTKMQMAAQAASVLGIPTEKILDALHGTYPNRPASYEQSPLPNLPQRISGLVRLLSEGQYAAATKKEVIGASHLSTPQTNKVEYTPDDRELVVRFDTDLPAFHHASLYLIDTGRKQLPVGPASKLGEIRDTLEFTIPMSRLAEIIGSSTWSHARLQLQVLSHDGKYVYTATTSGFALEGLPYKELSTLPAHDVTKAADRKKENIVLTQIAAQPYFQRQNGIQHIVDIGSDAHDRNGFHAVDINTLGNDIDHPVLSPASGEIIAIDLSYGSVTIQHDGWTSVLLHLPIYRNIDADGKESYIQKKSDGTDAGIMLYVGKEVEPGEQIGIVSGRGISDRTDHASAGVDEENRRISDQAFAPHIHAEARINGTSIDLTNMIPSTEGWNIPMYGSINYARIMPAPLQWTDAVDASDADNGLLANEEYRVIYYRNRDITNDEDNNYFVAWEKDKKPEEMERVVWDNSEDVKKWIRWDFSSNSWYRDGNNKRSMWDSNSQSWKSE